MPGGKDTNYLVRHAKAGSRERWTAPDRDRPLSDAGRLQASALVSVLRSGVRSIRSSPYLRCMETVAPLAKALGLEIEKDDSLAEGADPGLALNLLGSMAGAVLCTHGDVMASVVTSLTEAHVPMEGGLQWAKAGTWVFEASGGRIVSGRYLPPPV